MESLPLYVSLLFMLTTIFTILIFYRATNKSRSILLLVCAWILLHSLLALTGFYTVTDGTPPRFSLMIMPPLVLIIFTFLTGKGRQFLDGLSLRHLTLLHVIRIPVEIVLLLLCIHKLVPQLMTFEGRNFDILSGISAPLIYYFGFVRKRLNNKILLTWNFICLGLLLKIVIHAILSAPFPFQQLAFTQPNIGLLYFPFVWLPCCIVPIVLFSHLVSIRQLILSLKKSHKTVHGISLAV